MSKLPHTSTASTPTPTPTPSPKFQPFHSMGSNFGVADHTEKQMYQNDSKMTLTLRGQKPLLPPSLPARTPTSSPKF